MTTINTLMTQVEEIHRELQPNGGGTLRDAIVSIRNNQARERASRRLLIDTANMEVVVDPTTGDAEISYVSPAYVRLTGLSRDEANNWGWTRALAVEDRERVTELARQSFADEAVMMTTYTLVNVHNGTRTAVHHMGTPIFNHAREVIGWAAVMKELPTSYAT